MAPPASIKEVGINEWEIPTSYKKGMNVPARIIATKKLLQEMDDGVFDQVTNVATLPGIVGHAYCMSDGHWGYGFPIGGVAAFDVDKGVISPGGIGFDINCLAEGTRISTIDGIQRIEKFIRKSLPIATVGKRLFYTFPSAFMFQKPKNKLLKVKTETGFSVRATADHPFLTPYGMKELGKLKEGDMLTLVEKHRFHDVITEIKEIRYSGLVYDFTVPVTHNFIANNVVVSNCGMRLVTTNLTFDDVKDRIRELVDTLYKTVPAGVGCRGFLQLSRGEFDELMQEGTKWCVDKGYGWKQDIEHTEASGKIPQANQEQVSDKARQRGIAQIGTLGSGNHYLEIQRVTAENIHDKEIAKQWGLFPEQIVVMVHCGSRGFGHQIATDYLKVFLDAMPGYGISVPDRELACAPFQSKEGQQYFEAMACAANAAFANRQVILHRIREAFSKVFQTDAEKLEMNLLYDVAHNMAKLEEHKVDGKKQKLIVHRKGATRSFGPGAPDLNPLFSKTGQPVILGGSMETGSYLLAGTQTAMEKTFGSTAHGSGRTMSRTKAVQMVRGEKLQREMEARGIYVKAVSMSGLAEEAGFAYKDIHEVVKSIDEAGISKKIVGLLPIGNVKG